MDPELPVVAQVYWVQPWIFLDGDPKDERPVVVVAAPMREGEMVTVVERTSTRVDLRGVAHPADSSLELDLPGKWVHRFTRKVQERHFRPPNVRLVGMLDSPYIDDVMKMWFE